MLSRPYPPRNPGVVETRDGEGRHEDNDSPAQGKGNDGKALEGVNQLAQSEARRQVGNEDPGAEREPRPENPQPLLAQRSEVSDKEDDRGERAGVNAVDQPSGDSYLTYTEASANNLIRTAPVEGTGIDPSSP